MNKQILLIICFLAVTAFLTWQYFLPALDKIMLLRGELESWQKELSDTQGLKQKLSDLKKKYDSMVSEADRVTQAITPKDDLPGLLVQFEQLSSQNGLILDSAAFNSPDDKKDKKALATSSGLKILTAELSLSGSQSALVPFLKAVENNLRIMDVSALSFGEAGLDKGGQVFNVSLNIYHLD